MTNFRDDALENFYLIHQNKKMIDHLIIGAPTLEEGVEYVFKKSGLKAIYGGKHPGFGTHNALLGLGKGVYLEIIAPDPEQKIDGPLWMGLEKVSTSKLISWAAKSSELESLCRLAKENDIDLGSIFPGQRMKSDGQLLKWKLTDPRKMMLSGTVPFFIDWGNSPHPSNDLPSIGEIASFGVYSNEVEKARGIFTALNLNIPVLKGESNQLFATISISNKVLSL